MGTAGFVKPAVIWLFCVYVALVHCQSEDKPQIYSLHIRSDIQFRFASTLVTSRLANPVNSSREAVFKVTLPKEAFISNFTLEIDGVVYPGDIKEKEKAKKQFESAKKRGQSAGLVSQSPRDTRNFKVEVNVAAFSKVTFNLTYQEILQRTRGIYQHKIYVNPGQPVKDLQINVAIQESRDITTLRVPPIRDDILTNDIKDEQNTIAVITKRDPRSALVSYVPSIQQQTEKATTGISGQFIVEYDVDRSMDAGDLLVVNGYFVHFIAPDIQTDLPKDVIFILDTSGSMDGRKFDQLKAAMYEILADLQPEDRFNVLTFESSISFMYGEFIEATPENVIEAKNRVRRLSASGGTNINSGLLEGIRKFVDASDAESEERASVILFLTDGEATSGTTDTNKILSNVQRENLRSELEIPINSLAFGNGADWGLIKKVALQNNGVARKIYEDSDAALQITGFYQEVSNTLLRNVSVEYLGDTVDKDSLTKSELGSFFTGSELIVAGKLGDKDATTLNLNVLGSGADGNLVLALDPKENVVDFSKVTGLIDNEDFAKITEKMWAYLTIKEYMKKIDSGELAAEVVEELKAKALDLSLKYSFVTRLTSMVVTKPEEEPTAEEVSDDEDEVNADSSSGSISRSSSALQYAPQSSPGRSPSRKVSSRRRGGGGGGGGGGGYGGGGGGDPHYMVRIYGLDHPLCFDFDSQREEFYQIIQDPIHDITINAATVVSDQTKKNGENKTFIGEIGVKTKHHVIVVTPDAIIFDKKILEWDDKRVHHFGNNNFSVLTNGNDVSTMSFRFNFGPVVYIQRHIRRDRGLTDYLNIYISREDGFSKRTKGLIGQFVNGQKHVLMKKNFASKSDEAIAKLQVREGPLFHLNADGSKGKKTRHSVRANLVRRPEIVTTGTEKCWMVHKPFMQSLIGNHDDYVVPLLLPFMELVEN